ncbi:YGGT family protein [Melissococcus plutonius]|uniref:Cell division protein YlmG/ Ycf19 (Putative), YggT family n=1 Tax=Melissococcus plutonius (strain ATCC 35311 / DSM 29964 / CIP 104052 / LMG 20360 / NCIMB 702443) TaxID=940190 RepID=F3Y9R5_MELPT|nr:YggT family protein [Melissococcus plutonius]AIM24778.2 YGGT family protein [Melissococcus plutonius S1]KMT24892.1 YGGT family protein [Melissococcus plutonius]KMT26529.1 YGGT family protein [Melissococcus plutonius]KMT27779.1 YGGT family protein [Melissococcus plutonius]KMT29551.1 YGGT family protein [Melissococcus plutonius]
MEGNFILAIIITFLYKAVQIYSGILVIYALLSWFPGAYDSKLGQLIARICETYLSLFDRLNLHIGMIGFNVIIGIIVLNLAAGGLGIILQSIAY